MEEKRQAASQRQNLSIIPTKQLTKNRSQISMPSLADTDYVNKKNLLNVKDDENCVNGQFLCH